MSETFRAFIAIDLPENVRSSLGEAQAALRSGGFRIKWVQPQNIHLTLKFLGNTDTADIDKIVAAMTLAAEDFAALPLAAKGIGVFPNMRRPRVIWAGLNGQIDILKALQQTLDGHLAERGFPKETRGFKAHLTLGRFKGKVAPARLQQVIDQLKGFESESFEVRQIILYKSELRPGGAVYTRVKGVAL